MRRANRGNDGATGYHDGKDYDVSRTFVASVEAPKPGVSLGIFGDRQTELETNEKSYVAPVSLQSPFCSPAAFQKLCGNTRRDFSRAISLR